MPLTPLSADLNNVQKFDNYPSDDTSPAEIKAAFDKAGNDIKNYINGTLIPETQAAISAAAQAGAAVSANGVFAFKIIDGDLIVSYSGSTPPDMSIDANGDLIMQY